MSQDQTRDPSAIMRYFEFEHLPARLQRYSRPFCLLAKQIDVTMKNGPEKSVCLRKLLEAKDACVRASLDEPQDSPGPSPVAPPSEPEIAPGAGPGCQCVLCLGGSR